MLYTGPWHDAITDIDPADKSAIAGIARSIEKASKQGDAPAAPWLTTHFFDADGGNPAERRWIGVRVANDFAAVLTCTPAYQRREWIVSSPPVMRVAIWVEPQWRRRGMAQALLIRCISVNRRAGVRQLVFFDLDGDAAMRKLVCRFSADLLFMRGECQAWLELGTATEHHCRAWTA
ncbi:MAG: hypothetical protein R3D44_00585 [Hyphomicrobiaceae bacterium]